MIVQNMAHRQSISHLLSPSVSLFIGLQNCLNSISISNDKPLKQIRNDIFSFVQRIGPEGQKFVITHLIQSVQLTEIKDKNNSSYKLSLLSEIMKQYSTYDSFMSYFPQIIIKVTKDKDKQNKINQLITNIMTFLKLSLANQISIALSLYLSDRNQLIEIGESQLIQKLKQYQNSDKSIKLPQKLLQQLLFQININPQLSNKLQNQNRALLDASQKLNKNSQTKIYNYFRDEWQFFANQTPIIQKPPQIALRKTDILRDLGPTVTQQPDTLKAIISQIGPLNEQDIFQCLMMMAEQKNKHDNGLDRFVTDLMHASSVNSGKKTLKGEQFKKLFTYDLTNKKVTVLWNVDNFLLYCIQNIQNIKWQNVFANFDRENLNFSSDAHFVEIMKIFDKIKKLAKKWTLPDSILFKKWVHANSQAEFLYHLFSCKQPDCIFFNETQPKKSQNPKQAANNALRQIWGYLDLVSLLFQVSQFKKDKIKQLLQIPIVRYSDLFIRTLSEIKPTKGQQMVNQIYATVLPQFLQNDSKSIQIIEYLWHSNKELLIKTIIQLHKNGIKKHTHIDIDKIVQIFKNIQGSLDQIIISTQLPFSLPIALISGKKQYINLQKFLITKIDKNQSKFSKQVLAYLQNNLFKQLRVTTQTDQKQNILDQANLNIQVLNKIFTVFIEKLKKQYSSSKHLQIFKKLHKQSCQLFPQIAQGHISQQAQRQCEQQIKKIYKQQISINDAIQNLKRLKNSTKKQQKQQFANRITFLCIEMTYHHSYPQKQLMITADLFSALINANMIEKKIFQVFLHVIDEEYLRTDNAKFIFALKVMDKIKSRLAHQTWFCQKLVQNQLMMRKEPQLIESIIKNIEPPTILSMEIQRKIKQAIRLKNSPPQTVRHIIIQPQTHHDHHPTMKKAQVSDFDILATLDRSKKIQFSDRQSKLKLINTICNTLSLANAEDKAKQLKKSLDNQKALLLFVYNIVFKRITITQNNGIEAFIKLIQNIPKAEKPILNITYKILQSWFTLNGKSVNDKKLQNFKNVGAWLGRMTIGKGIPVPIYKLNIKKILIKSFKDNNRLNYNIPVVLKILQLITKHPQIFKQQSPWLRRIMRALVEIETNLKQDSQVKTQIRAFFKTAKMDIESFLTSQPSFLANQSQFCLNQLLQSVNASEQLFKLCDSFNILNIRSIIAKVLQNSIQQIMQPVIDRTVKIAKITTKQIIIKDFAMQTNSVRVKQASLNLVRQLSAPLAQVTCREPLKTNMMKNLKQSLKSYWSDSKVKQEEGQKLIQLILTQNLDFGCMIIKQKVVKQAQKSIKQDHQLCESIQLRNVLRKSGSNYIDQQYIKTIPQLVPKQLKPNNSGLTEEEYQIYNQLKKSKNKQYTNKISQSINLGSQQNILQLIQQKQQINKIQKIILSAQIPQQQLLYKVHTNLLQENNDELQFQYYLQICQSIKEVISQQQCWRKFKQIADLRLKQTQRVIRKLVRQKYFDQSVLSELSQQQQKSIKFFEEWLTIQQQQIQQYIQKLSKILINNNEGSIRQFFYYSLKYIFLKFNQQKSQYIQSFDTNYIQQYLYLIVLSYKKSKGNYSQYIQQVVDAIIQYFLKAQPKHHQTNYQRQFFKIIINLISMICQENKQFNLDLEKVTIFIQCLAKQLIKISPIYKPNFAFCWLEILFNKYLIKYLLQNYDNWDLYFNLLCSLLKFIKQNISQSKLYNKHYGEIYQKYYQAVLKLIIIIIHDFSPFLSAFSLQLCLLVDSRFIQLKNIINSALPFKSEEIPMKFQKRENLEALVKKIGYPKYYNLMFDKQKLNIYLNSDFNDNNFKQKISQQQDLFLQTFVLYIGWLPQNKLTQNQAMKKLTSIISNSKQEIKAKLVNYSINLIRYPNYITLFFIDFALHIIFKQKDNSLRELMLSNIITRMKGEVPIAWGLIYLVQQEFVNRKKELEGFNILRGLLEQL